VTIDVFEIVVILVLAALFWWGNTFNPVPVLNKLAKILIVVFAVLALLVSLGLIAGPDIKLK